MPPQPPTEQILAAARYQVGRLARITAQLVRGAA